MLQLYFLRFNDVRNDNVRNDDTAKKTTQDLLMSRRISL